MLKGRENPVLGLVVPCYNEEEALIDTAFQLGTYLDKLIEESVVSELSFIAFIDDGSFDDTWKIIINLSQEKKFKGLKLAGNVGHQRALLAGLLEYKNQADCIISLDADLQDDISVMGEMITNFKNGSELVFGVRKERSTDSFLKKSTAETFYRLMKVMQTNTIFNHADYRLMSKKALYTLEQYREFNLYLRGIFPNMGYKNDIVYYSRKKRLFGEPKYSFGKLLTLSLNGITSFSVAPLRMITALGFLFFIVSIVLILYVLVSYFYGEAPPGWASTTLPMYFLGGIQLLCFGILGEYLGKIYLEVKQRPRYIVEERLD